MPDPILILPAVPSKPRKIKRASVYKRRWRARRRAAALGIPVPAIPPRRVTRKRLKQLRAARLKSDGRPPILDPKPSSVRMRAFRARRRMQRAAVREIARLARKAALAAARAAKGLPPAGTPASRQKAYRERRRAKGLDPYKSPRKLAEVAAKAAAEARLYDNRVPDDVIDQWFAPRMDAVTAITFVRQHVIPNQPEAAEKYIERIQEQCRRYALNLNRYTLKPDGIEHARHFRALVFMQNGGKYLAASWNIAQFLRVDKLPRDPAAREALINDVQAVLGAGDAIAADMHLIPTGKEKSDGR